MLGKVHFSGSSNPLPSRAAVVGCRDGVWGAGMGCWVGVWGVGCRDGVWGVGCGACGVGYVGRGVVGIHACILYEYGCYPCQ